ncbi:MAG TPA: RES domain-containing protein [Aurantimonas coralicida]|uniref:RES domain-containing protein n=2 Tax=root TaxID=1 RepID=A0A9C9TH91_9HYPH|nr:RES domain-containing protein [Aurantimonas coralicida]HEU00979.1 RES domain-containing protein [Aurantimonas coralicida]
MQYRGLLYRALNPLYARDPLSGHGAALYGGRFNRPGQAALYTALTPGTAIREANQVGTLQPTTLVAYRADFGPVFDTCDKSILGADGMDDDRLAAKDWRLKMKAGGAVVTHDFAERLIGEGYAGLLVRSFAPGASGEDLNLVLWQWNTGAGDGIEVVDDEGRLA